MWFLSFVPDWLLTWAIHGAVIVGLFLVFGGSLLKNIPIIGTYASFANQIGSVLLLIGVFFEGGLGVEMIYRAKIADMQAKIKIAEQQSKEVNTKIETKIVERVKVIKEKTNGINIDIEKKRDSINAECKLSDDAWLFYNRSVKNVLAGSTNKSN